MTVQSLPGKLFSNNDKSVYTKKPAYFLWQQTDITFSVSNKSNLQSNNISASSHVRSHEPMSRASVWTRHNDVTYVMYR